MGGDTAVLPADIDGLRRLVIKQSKELSELQEENYILVRKAEVLEDELRLLRHKLFGRRSERLTAEDLRQASLFDEAEWISEEQRRRPPETIIEVGAHHRRKRGRKPLPADLPREEVLHDIPEEEKICSCGEPLVGIGEETSEKLEIIPQQIKVIRHIRPKYACRNCEGTECEQAVKIAPVPPQIIPKSIATPGLLSYVLVSKFCDAIPFYRQEKLFRRIGSELSRMDFANWAIQVARQCDPLIEVFLDDIRAGPVVQMDETRLQVMKELNRANTTKSYMWVIRGGPPENPVILYRYHPTRSETIPLQYLSDYEGFLPTDGYDGYTKAGKRPGITHSGCWAHARRKFDEASKASKKSGSAEEALGRIGKICRIEQNLRAQQLEPEAFARKRKEKVLPILKSLKKWLQLKVLQVPPSTLLGKAVTYTLNEWEKLLKYLDSPYLTPDTNLMENAIRPFVLGRKNRLFSGSPRGAHASATLFSLIETAKANGLEPYRYLKYVFIKIPVAVTQNDYRSLTPQYLDREDFRSFLI
ncbi:MAG: IS66 family transposase [Spirochaetaceae bacterium]|nr:MAG: IS66 family transposase [Spirochaetaceae bacterium]